MSKLKWFGLKPFANICFVTDQIAIPVGKSCEWCHEGFTLDDHGVAIPMEYLPFHGDCFLRTVFGSVGHQSGDCECNGSIDTSEDGMSLRDAATASVAMFRHRVATDMGLFEKPTVH